MKNQEITFTLPKIKVIQESRKAFNEGYRIIVNQGGTRSGKTFSLSQLLIFIALTHKVSISVTSVAFPHLRKGAMRDWRKIMEDFGLYKPGNHMKTEQLYTYETGSYIEFFSVDNALKVRGPGRDILFVNEANIIDYDVFRQLLLRTKKCIFIDYNPADEFHWIYDKILTRKDCYFIKSTYKDNPFLPYEQIKEIESYKETDSNFWRIYGEGERGHSEGIIYTGWQTYNQSNIDGGRTYGLDFGYNNPTALVKVTEKDKSLYAQEIIYQSHLTNQDLIILLRKHVGLHEPIFADAAEPQRIEEIRRAGFNIRPANKAVKDGIDFIKSRKLFIHQSSANLLKEIKSYKYMGTKSNKNEPEEPLKLNDHACFVAETQITTIHGYKNISDVEAGDYVLTRQGYRPVVKRFDNGIRQTVEYFLYLDTKLVTLQCTEDHLINTDKGWIHISKLKSGMTVNLASISTVKSTSYNPEKDILNLTSTICTMWYGNTTTYQLFQKDTTYTMQMETLGITNPKTLNVFLQISTFLNTANNGLKTIQNGLRSFGTRVLRLLKIGTNPMRVKSGTHYTVEYLGVKGNIERLNVNNVVMNTKQNTQGSQNFVIQTAKLKHFEKGKKNSLPVFDLEVEGCHEYFANGILVHNCDAMRYGAMGLKKAAGMSFGVSVHR